MTITSGYNTAPKSYNEQGFLITSTTPTTTVAPTYAPCFGANCGLNGKIIGTSSSKASAPRETAVPWRSGAIIGIAMALAERLLL
jgi:hypothetical protein